MQITSSVLLDAEVLNGRIVPDSTAEIDIIIENRGSSPASGVSIAVSTPALTLATPGQPTSEGMAIAGQKT